MIRIYDIAPETYVENTPIYERGAWWSQPVTRRTGTWRVNLHDGERFTIRVYRVTCSEDALACVRRSYPGVPVVSAQRYPLPI